MIATGCLQGTYLWNTTLKKNFDNVLLVSSIAGIYDHNELNWEEWAKDFLFHRILLLLLLMLSPSV